MKGMTPKEMDQMYADWLFNKINTLRTEESRDTLTVYLKNGTRICFSRWTDGDFSASVTAGNVATFTTCNYAEVSVELNKNVISTVFYKAGLVDFRVDDVEDVL